jgi:hypothetical protein
MAETNIQGAKFSGYGRCIYCGATSLLKDEHIIPHSLGGTAVILQASCADCEKITSYLDGYLARDIFNEYRSHVGIQSRRRKQRPATLLASFLKIDGSEEVRSYPAKEQPYMLRMPIWHLPGIALGKPPSPEFEITQSHIYNFVTSEVDEWMKAEGIKIGIWPYINYPTFARAIARIAFCQAVTQFGLDGFNHLDLPALILGSYPNAPHYVGVGREDPPPPDARAILHKVEIQGFAKDGTNYWMASVRLFAHSGYKDHGMPIYRVIVGAPLAKPSPSCR